MLEAVSRTEPTLKESLTVKTAGDVVKDLIPPTYDADLYKRLKEAAGL